MAVLTSRVLAGALLMGYCGHALAAKGVPDSVYCSPAECEVCVEYEHAEGGDRCLKCAIQSTDLCVDKSGAVWTPGAPHLATVKDDVDVYDKPVEPRSVIGIMRATSAAVILDYHPDGWCKLELKAFPAAHNGSGEGWIAQDHLEGCP